MMGNYKQLRLQNRLDALDATLSILGYKRVLSGSALTIVNETGKLVSSWTLQQLLDNEVEP